MISEKRFVQPDDMETVRLNWSTLRWMNAPEATGSEGFSAGVVLLEPGRGHERHTHPDSEEMLYPLGDEGEQTIGDETRTIGAGDMVHIPNGVEYSTVSTSRESLRFLTVYCPSGPEAEIRMDDDATVFPPGEFPGNWFARSSALIPNFVAAGSLAGRSVAGQFFRNIKVARGGLSTRMKYIHAESLNRIEATIEAGDPAISTGTGIGISVKFAERGGVDLLIIYNSGRYRMNGRGSLAGLLPYDDANEIVVEMDREVIPVVEDTPVLTGVNGTNPFRDMSVFIEDLHRRGFSDVQNFPAVRLIDEGGNYRKNLEEAGMGYDKGVEIIHEAGEQGMLTCPYVFTERQAAAMIETDAGVTVSHMGLTTSDDIGTETALDLDDVAERVQAHHGAAKMVRDDVHVICRGGPTAWPDDAAYVLNNIEGVVGFFGASSIERLATEEAIEDQAHEFKEIEF